MLEHQMPNTPRPPNRNGRVEHDLLGRVRVMAMPAVEEFDNLRLNVVDRVWPRDLQRVVQAIQGAAPIPNRVE